ncbi:MAG: hypothetical protein J6U09_01050 [Lachnospiraceae bacterium]|nr:hypothetical protein [Lachnospiraceae bacterium]
MINLKRIGSTALAIILVASTAACTLSVPSDKGNENANAQIVSRDPDGDTEPDPEPLTEPEKEEEEQFVLAQMDSKYHAYYDGKVYYREYKKSDYAEDIVLYYSDPFEGGLYNSTTPKKLCALNADGSVETITEEDHGQGVMYVIDGVLYSQYYNEDGAEADINATHVYSLDLNTKKESDIAGYCQVYGKVGDYLILRQNNSYEGADYKAGDLTLYDPKTSKVISSLSGVVEYLGCDYTSMYGYQVDSDYTSGDAKYTVTIYRGTKDGDAQTLTTLSSSLFEDWYLGYPEITCYQIVGSHLFLNIGYYQGTGHFYQEGMIMDIDVINKTSKKITDTGVETFYITEGMDGMFINTYDYNINTENNETICVPVDGEGEMKAEDYVGQKFMVPYVHYDYSETTNMKRGDVSILTDVAGKPNKLLSKSDYDGFGYTLGAAEGADYEDAEQTEIYNIEYAGNKLFFSIAIMERTPEYDVGWRYSYKVQKFANFVKDLKTGEVTKLYEE